MREIIEEPDGMVHCHWPEVSSDDAIRLMHGGMDHHGASHLGDDTYAAFSNTVLVRGSDTRERQFLIMLGKFCQKIV